MFVRVSTDSVACTTRPSKDSLRFPASATRRNPRSTSESIYGRQGLLIERPQLPRSPTVPSRDGQQDRSAHATGDWTWGQVSAKNTAVSAPPGPHARATSTVLASRRNDSALPGLISL
jgi:hypothetical protein